MPVRGRSPVSSLLRPPGRATDDMGDRMRPLALDDEQVAFWRRHTHTGVALCVVLPLVVVARTALAGTDPGRSWVLYVAAGLVALLSPLLLLVDVDRVVRHRLGRLFYDVWEAVGVLLVVGFCLLDGGGDSPWTAFFYVLLAHAALSYPPLGMLIAGAGNIVGYLTVAVVAGDVPAADLLAASLTLLVATATCAFASYNHTTAYQRTSALARQLAVVAERDGLTGCLNHRTFHARLQAEAMVADGSRPLSLLVVDVDSFKQVNDAHGHPAGDEVLRLVGATLLELSRADDAAGRLGGDEFALLLPRTGSPPAVLVADRLREQVRRRTAEYGVTVSVGVATTSTVGHGAGLVAAADRAVYRAKRAGRDQSVLAAGASTEAPAYAAPSDHRT